MHWPLSIIVILSLCLGAPPFSGKPIQAAYVSKTNPTQEEHQSGNHIKQSVLPKAQKSLVSMLDCLSCAGFNQAALSKRTPLYPFVVYYVSEGRQTVCDVFAARAMYIQLWIGRDVFPTKPWLVSHVPDRIIHKTYVQ